MIEDRDFDALCDDFVMSLEYLPKNQFNRENETALTLGNPIWKTHIFCHDDTIEDTREGLLMLFNSRRDLIRPIIENTTFRGYLSASWNLAKWLEPRGYSISLDAKSRWNTFRISAFLWLARVVSSFQR